MTLLDVPTQLAFPDLVLPPSEGPLSLDERFARFHANNPQVADRLREIAVDMVAHGAKRIGIGMVYEIARWSSMRTRRDEGWLLDNSFRSRYARLLADADPRLAGVFEFRRLHNKDHA